MAKHKKRCDEFIIGYEIGLCFGAENPEVAMRMISDSSVRVVRCKDCLYWADRKVNKKGFSICPATGMEITPRDYCSYGVNSDG